MVPGFVATASTSSTCAALSGRTAFSLARPADAVGRSRPAPRREDRAEEITLRWHGRSGLVSDTPDDELVRDLRDQRIRVTAALDPWFITDRLCPSPIPYWPGLARQIV